jgi:Tfp pilus assembly protein PilF
MVSKLRWTKRAAAFALALVLVAGCQSTGPTASPATVSPAAEPRAALTAAQQADVKIALGRSLEKSGDLDRAIAIYGDALAKDPTRYDACLRLAALHERQGRLTESREWYRKALALQPTNADVYCNLGYSLYLEGNLEPAANYLRHAVQLQPNHARAHNNLGLVLARLKQSQEALAEFKKAGESPADAHINLAYCFMVDGSTAQARQHFEMALQMEPNSTAAKKALADLSAVDARLQGAPSGVVVAANAAPSSSVRPIIPAGGPVRGAGKQDPTYPSFVVSPAH